MTPTNPNTDRELRELADNHSIYEMMRLYIEAIDRNDKDDAVNWLSVLQAGLLPAQDGALREALEPFSKAALEFDDDESNDLYLYDYQPAKLPITIGDLRRARQALASPAPRVEGDEARPKIQIDREWIRKKALEEDGHDISAGSLAHPLRVPETAMKLQAAIDKLKFLQPGLENSNSSAEDAMVDYLPTLLSTMEMAISALSQRKQGGEG